MALVALAGEAARPDAMALGAFSRLQELEQVPVDHLLQPRLGALHLDVRPRPEVADQPFVPTQDGVEPALQGAVERPGHLRPDLRGTAALVVVVGQVLPEADRLAALPAQLEHDRREVVLAGGFLRDRAVGFEAVVHAAAQDQARAAGGVAEDRAQAFAARPGRPQHPAGEADRQPRVGAVAAGQRLAVQHLGGDDDLGVGFLRHQLVPDRRQMPLVEGDEPERPQPHPPAAGRQPSDLADQGARRKIQGPAVGEHLRLRREKGFAIDEELHNGAVGTVQDALADAGEAIGVLAVGDRPELVEPVEEHARLPRRSPLVRGAADAEVAVGQREHRLGRAGVFAGELRVEAQDAERPGLWREDVGRRQAAFTQHGHPSSIPSPGPRLRPAETPPADVLCAYPASSGPFHAGSRAGRRGSSAAMDSRPTSSEAPPSRLWMPPAIRILTGSPSEIATRAVPPARWT